MSRKTVLAITALAALAACAGSWTKPSATEADFGKSVASMVKAQTQDPGTLSNPSTEAVTGVDPDYATKVIDAMREGVSKPTEVKQPIEIRVGGQGKGGT
jgi:type IV pilus biogenesis protein CpaD/CtpE